MSKIPIIESDETIFTNNSGMWLFDPPKFPLLDNRTIVICPQGGT